LWFMISILMVACRAHMKFWFKRKIDDIKTPIYSRQHACDLTPYEVPIASRGKHYAK
jgi:hypothetical protein